ncbi:hypothetical protein KC343_g8591 [Hortaea werneckii]|nr:hypothetical protein KC352_g18911 [Hortaea werneckii]KAI7562244.1 hypothetical protein KC317_g8542 [Hortaea werneckii]KAI7612752.1 hypothetical protein KC346_g7667 [Hortaea werneckii]KAI7619778.1 hypothetical protein KC343_g8591 [Hortaea werneckii]KAI7654266.1 hypothetical protein KC319_g10309 [Hortaea werneckii]
MHGVGWWSQYLRKLIIGPLKPEDLPNVPLRDDERSRGCGGGRGEGDERDVPGGPGCGGGGGGGGGVVVSRATSAPAAEEGGEGRDDPLPRHWGGGRGGDDGDGDGDDDDDGGGDGGGVVVVEESKRGRKGRNWQQHTGEGLCASSST